MPPWGPTRYYGVLTAWWNIGEWYVRSEYGLMGWRSIDPKYVFQLFRALVSYALLDCPE
jgi:hypothetical protein